MKKLLALFVLIAPAIVFAGEHGSGHTDIIPRTFNFIIFVGLAYYLLGDAVKSIFSARREAIAADFEIAQKKLKESMTLREEAKAKAANASRHADDLIALARHESEMIAEKITEQGKRDIILLEKHFEEFKHSEERKMVLRCVEEELSKGLQKSTLGLDDKTIISLLEKKVA